MAVRVTVVPLEYVALQVEPQLIPPGLLVTKPVPVPLFDTVNKYVVGAESVKVAVTERAWFISTWHW